MTASLQELRQTIRDGSRGGSIDSERSALKLKHDGAAFENVTEEKSGREVGYLHRNSVPVRGLTTPTTREGAARAV